ncbi:MAG: nucleotidyltransferase [Pelosinus sp.]|nr:nucleotidyltransferase [Pelosinus sp.]
MKAVGFIVEYNPFHNGHAWHLAQAKELSGCEFSVGVMSGNFMQRGEPALFDKWKRAEMAVQGGVDLVIELPFVFAVRSAQYFAAGGIRLLSRLGIISHVCFGAETNQAKILDTIAKAEDQPEVTALFKQNLKKGVTYAAALSQAIENVYGISGKILSSPNTILAVEYLRAIAKYAPELIPLPIKRQENQYHDKEIKGCLASASAIRQAIYDTNALTPAALQAIPATTTEVINQIIQTKRGPSRKDSLSAAILARLRTAELARLKELPEIGEGLEYKINECSLEAENLTEFLTMLKSKRYPQTRLQRIITHAIIGTTRDQISHFDQTGPLYTRILAFNGQGRQLLKQISQQSDLPLITKTTHFLNSRERSNLGNNPLKNMLAIDTLASDIYTLTLPTSHWNKGGLDFRQTPIYVPW